MANNLLTLVESLATASQVLINYASALQSASETIRRAQQEGRDVTETELDIHVGYFKGALARLDEVLKK